MTTICELKEYEIHQRRIDTHEKAWSILNKIISTNNIVEQRELMIELAFLTDAKWWLKRENLI